MPKYWKRLLWFCLFLAAVPAIAVGWVSYSIASGGIEEKVIEGNRQILHQTRMRIEQLLRMVELSSLQFARSSAMMKYSDAELSVYHYEEMRELANGLAQLQTLTGVEEARLVHFEHDWLLSLRYLRPFSEAEEHEEFTAYQEHAKSLFWVNLGDHSPPLLRMVLKLPAIPGTPAKNMLTVDLSAAELQQQLTQSRELGNHFILGADGSPLLGSEPDVPEGVREAITEWIRTTGAAEGFFYFETDQERSAVAYLVAPFNGWIYASVIPYSAITGQSKQIALWTWAVCLCIALLALCSAYFGSRRFYFPVRRLFEFARNMEDPLDPGQTNDEFTLIEKRLQRLSDHGKMLQRQIRGQYSQLKELFVFKLFMGQADEKELLRQSRMYAFPVGWSSLSVMALQIDRMKEGSFRERDRDLLLFAVNNMVGELLPQHQRFSPVVLDNAQVTLIAGFTEDPEEGKRQLQQAAETIRSKVNEYLKLEVSIGISRPFRQLRDASKGYYEALEALKCRFRLGSNCIVHLMDLEFRHRMRAADYARLRLLEDKMLSSVKMADRHRTEALFEEYVAAIMAQESISREATTLMLPLITKVYQIVLEQGTTVRHALGERAAIDVFLKLSTFEEVRSWFLEDLFAPLFRFLDQQLESRHIDIANRMIQIIQERYDEDLTLEMCAEMLNFHPVYLSRVFKRETGTTFTEYVTEYRMQIAKRWLEETTYKISDIAAKLKYTNTSAFIRTFRRIVGMTPGQYREQMRNRELKADLLPDV